MQSTAPSSGGEGSLPQEPQHYELLCHFLPIFPFQLKKFLRTWHHKMLEYQVPCHTPSFKTVFIKHAAVLDQLCNHKQAIADWSTSNPPTCCCKSLVDNTNLQLSTRPTTIGSSPDPFFTLFVPPSLAVIAEGSLSNKVFPSKKEYLTQLRSGLQSWTKRNGLPSMPASSASQNLAITFGPNTVNTSPITLPNRPLLNFNPPFEGAVFHCEDKQCILLTDLLSVLVLPIHREQRSKTLQSSKHYKIDPTTTVTSLVNFPPDQKHGKAYPWAVGAGRQLPAGYILAKRKKELPQRTTHHFLRGLTVPTHAQHSGPTHLPTHPSRMSQITLLQEMFTLFCQF